MSPRGSLLPAATRALMSRALGPEIRRVLASGRMFDDIIMMRRRSHLTDAEC